MSQSNGDGFFKGFVFGGMIGAVLAFLYAPKSGQEMRDDIRRRSREFYDDADIHFAELKRQAGDVIAEGRRQAELLRQQADAKLRETRAKAEQIISRGRQQATDGAEETAEQAAEVRSKAQNLIEEGKKKVSQTAAKFKSAVEAGTQAYREELEEKKS